MPLVKRAAITVAGLALLAVGAALMVLPGPGILLIVAGLAVLATEYVWARNLVAGAKVQAERVQREAVASPLRTAASIVFAIGLGAVGVLMMVVDDVTWPTLDSTLDSFWSPVAGGIIVASALIVLGTTVYTVRNGRREATAETSRA